MARLLTTAWSEALILDRRANPRLTMAGMATYDVSEIAREQALDQLAEPKLKGRAPEVRQLASCNDDPAAGEILDPSSLSFPRSSAAVPRQLPTDLEGSR
jgi:hypothetical protein